ncbi:MAG: ClpXP protease specificity-enhancing factor SspB [Alphaproteobacteria bacterium]|nr:ClpXP protease specificity-enhancing factor SspB [Alphaproteobacteria bacterium]
MTNDINYSQLIDTAMRGVVRDVLRQASQKGLTGDHHFYISFDTGFPGVRVSETIRSKYPKDMTIVLQHQFWDFKVEEQQFQVTLSFSGVPEKLVIPYAALTAFADPSVKFGLQFQAIDAPDFSQDNVEDSTDEPAATDDEASAEVISLDAFRKK